MSLETSGLCKLVHKKSDFYESSARSNEPLSEPSKNKYINFWTVLATCLPSIQPILRCIHVKGQLFYFLNIYSLFNLNPSDYELQTKETGVSADQ